MYEGLKAAEVIKTIDNLLQRIADRFPDSSLWRVCNDLLEIARDAQNRSERIERPQLLLRFLVGVLVVALVGLFSIVLYQLHPLASNFDFGEFVGVLEASMNVVVLMGVAIFFFISLERRGKRGRALQAVHELRAIAHVIDMHQLNMDPDRIYGKATPTAHEPERLPASDMGRYLDFCSEMLSLVGKIAALYVRRFDDPVAIESVNDVEALTTGLSRKIWQKIMILDTMES